MGAVTQSSIGDAVDWISGLLLGSISIVLATLFVAFVGLGMMWGRLSMTAAGRGILGMFVLFGAPAIAQGMMGGILGERVGFGSQPERAPVAIPKEVPNFDPYAGATTPTGR